MDDLSTRVETESDLMTIALAAEREAIQRYTSLAKKMRNGNNGIVAELFERMANKEHEHVRLLLEWMAEEGIAEKKESHAVNWHDPNISTTYNDESCDPNQSTPYRALAFAVHNEEIAFRFYTHVAANSTDITVRKCAETLAREELGHAAILRAERRRAFHAERETKVVGPRLDPKSIHTKSDLLAAAIKIDRFLVAEMNRLAKKSVEIKKLAQKTQMHIDVNKDFLYDNHNIETESLDAEVSGELDQAKSSDDFPAKAASTTVQYIQQLCVSCDRSFAFYDAVVDMTADETVMLSAQDLSSLALDRIEVLKQAIEKKLAE